MERTVKERVIKCIKLTVIFVSLNFMFDYFFRPSNIDLVRNFSVAVGVSIGINFGDKIFKRRKK